MKCEEFRKLVTASEDSDFKCEQHLNTCPACSEWLSQTTVTPPEGLLPAQWQPATAGCFPAKLPEMTKANDADKPKSFWEMYTSGLKYGFVFGLSLVTGFALLDFIQKPPQQPANTIEQISFVDKSDEKLPDFYKNEFSDVTFFELETSQIMSFMPKEQILDLIENEKEEEEWNETSG
ncbi:MAG: zf-HC2 domain-containing protein [Erysipelotrichia bacterium]|nr:zf-HC2 domain-containing protein [Erysipelotrichia bacterium]